MGLTARVVAMLAALVVDVEDEGLERQRVPLVADGMAVRLARLAELLLAQRLAALARVDVVRAFQPARPPYRANRLIYRAAGAPVPYRLISVGADGGPVNVDVTRLVRL